MTRLALISACASLALLGACKDATTGGGGSTSLGALPPASPPTEKPKNTTLITPVVQQSFNTFSANQHLKLTGTVGPDVTVPTETRTTINSPVIDPLTGLQAIDPVTGQPQFTQQVIITPLPVTQVPTSFSAGIPDNGNTIKPGASVATTYYEGSQPQNNSNEVIIDFNPRDAVYTVKADTASMVVNVRFQDPQHRTVYQQSLVPTMANYRYAESRAGADTPAMNANATERDINTIFVRDVGTTAGLTQYVTIAGFVGQKYKENEASRASAPGTMTVGVDFESDISRSVFAYGINTAHKDIPKSGSATYAGDMFAHVIITPRNYNTANDLRSIVGTSSTGVDFGTGKVTTTLAGNVVGFAGDTRSFAAVGSSNIFKPEKDTDNSRFIGKIDSWSFGAYNASGGIAVPTAASTVEGGFFGPKGEEVGGAFRIVGNRPDERIDILGAFAGKKGN